MQLVRRHHMQYMFRLHHRLLLQHHNSNGMGEYRTFHLIPLLIQSRYRRMERRHTLCRPLYVNRLLDRLDVEVQVRDIMIIHIAVIATSAEDQDMIGAIAGVGKMGGVEGGGGEVGEVMRRIDLWTRDGVAVAVLVGRMIGENRTLVLHDSHDDGEKHWFPFSSDLNYSFGIVSSILLRHDVYYTISYSIVPIFYLCTDIVLGSYKCSRGTEKSKITSDLVHS